MKKLLIFCLSSICLLLARENPFIDYKEVLNSKIINLDEFQDRAFNFESTIRILNEISFTFTNLDGSVETKTVKINKMVDWHDTYKLLRISQRPKEISAFLSIKTPSDEQKDLLKIELKEKELKIYTKDALLRDLSAQNPSVIMLDFKHPLTFLEKTAVLKNPPYKKIEFSSNKEFYRVKIYLDGKYGYELVRSAGEYIINLL